MTKASVRKTAKTTGDVTGAKCSAQLSCLKPILDTWRNLNLEYLQRHDDGDIPWWYGERTAVGFLAGATWKCGGVALEEWQTKKADKLNAKSDGRNGRCDLYILPKDFKAGTGLVCEAKKIVIRLEKPATVWNPQLKATIKHSKQDAQCLQGGKKEIPVGLVFAEFVFESPKRDADAATVKIKKWLRWFRQYRRKPSLNGFAYLFPTSLRNGYQGQPDKDHYYHVGTAVFISLASVSSRRNS